MLVSLTVGKVDAGVAVLLTQDNRLVSSVPAVTCAVYSRERLHRFCMSSFRRGCVHSRNYEVLRSRVSVADYVRILDRIPIRPPPKQHHIGQHRRHHCRAQQACRSSQRLSLPVPPETDPHDLRHQQPVSPRPPSAKCHANLPRPRMGPHRPCNRVSKVAVSL